MPKSKNSSDQRTSRFIPLRVKITVVLAILLLISLSVTAALFYIGSKRMLERSLWERLTNVSFQMRTATVDHFQHTLQILNAIALSYQRARDIENALLAQQKVNPDFKTMFLLDHAGTVKIILPYDKNKIDKKLDKEPLFSVPFYEKRTFVDPHLSRTLTDKSAIVMSVPLEMIASSRRSIPVKGVLGVAVPPETFFKTLQKYKISSNAYIFVIGEEGVIFQHGPPSIPEETLVSVIRDMTTGALSQIDTREITGTEGNRYYCSSFLEPTSHWMIGVLVPENDFSQRFERISYYVLLWIITSLVIGLLIIILFVNRINRSIKILSENVQLVGEGNLDVHIDLPSHDELGVLAQHFNTMVASLNRGQVNLADAYRQISSHELVKRDINVAHEIQKAMIPSETITKSNLEIAASYDPAREVGGDVLDYHEHPDGSYSILVADVSGKGIPAALVMAQTKIIFRVFSVEDRSPLSIMKKVNMHLHQNLRKTTFVTAFYGRYNPGTQKLQFCNAGHDPAYYYSAKSQAVLELSEDESCCLGAWGGFEGEEKELTISAGDSLLLYTDGATEATNPVGEMFEEIRLKKAFEKYQHLPAPKIIEKIKETIANFVDNAVLYDDLTLIVIKVPVRKS